MRIHLNISDNMSKADELSILQKLLDAFADHPTNYLTSLFRRRLVDWAETQMMDDFPCDVMANWDYVKEQLRLAEEALRKVESAAKSDKAAMVEVVEVIENLERTVAGKIDTIAEMELEIEGMRKCLKTTSTENEEIIGMMDAAVVRSEGLEREIVALKARLYDAGVAKEKK